MSFEDPYAVPSDNAMLVKVNKFSGEGEFLTFHKTGRQPHIVRQIVHEEQLLKRTVVSGSVAVSGNVVTYQITDVDGNPYTNATVDISIAGSSKTLTTDSKGRIKFVANPGDIVDVTVTIDSDVVGSFEIKI